MTAFQERYCAAREKIIARDFKRLNPMQRKAAMATEGPLLLLAGAGSGKTTVLIQRIYNLLTHGKESDGKVMYLFCRKSITGQRRDEPLAMFAVPGIRKTAV